MGTNSNGGKVNDANPRIGETYCVHHGRQILPEDIDLEEPTT
jgi:hypothetical protein